MACNAYLPFRSVTKFAFGPFESTWAALTIISLHSLTQVSQVSLNFLSLNWGWILQRVVSIQQLPAFFRDLLVVTWRRPWQKFEFIDIREPVNRKPSLREFILKYFHFYLLSYRVDKTRFSSSGTARDCYVHLDVSPTFQFVLKKFLNVWNAIVIYITLDVFVVNVFPCHVIHDEQKKIWTGKLVPATQLESVGVERITSLVRRPFHLISTHPPPPPRSVMENYIFGGGRCVGTVDLWSIPEPRGMGKEPRPDHSGGGTGSVAFREGQGDRKCWIALSFRKKSTRAPICQRRPFDRLEIIIGQRSLARMDNHERKNMHVILKSLQIWLLPGTSRQQAIFLSDLRFLVRWFNGSHREPTQSVCVADCYFIEGDIGGYPIP